MKTFRDDLKRLQNHVHGTFTLQNEKITVYARELVFRPIISGRKSLEPFETIWNRF